MANEQNLAKRTVWNAEQAAAAGRVGGVRSGEERRKRRSMREAAQAILQAKLPEGSEIAELLKLMGVEDPRGADAIMLAMADKARTGDARAAEFVRDTGGEKPDTVLAVGNLEDRPFNTLDLHQLSEDELKKLASDRADDV